MKPTAPLKLSLSTNAIRIGTASWSEPEFVKAEWYPRGLPAAQQLPFYAARFDMVELNSSFYAIPQARMCDRWACTIEAADDAVRLGLCVVNGLNRDHAEQMLQTRREQSFRLRQDFLRRTVFDQDELRTLASLGALNAFGGHRRDALWTVEEPQSDQPKLFAHAAPLPGDSPLAVMDAGERLQADYDGQNLTTGPHAMVLLRPHLPEGIWRAADLARARNGQRVRIAGNVICRQRPGTAKGSVFVSLEDETGIANAIVAPDLFEKLRLTITQEAYLLIEGRVQIAEGTIHIKAEQIDGLRQTGNAYAQSHDFH